MIQFMDSFVWCFLMLVCANCMIEITTAHHEKVIIPVHQSPASVSAKEATDFSSLITHTSTKAHEESTETKRPERITERISESSRDLPKLIKERPKGRSQRLELLDNIFNIPIATLKAVNNLVQSIATSFHPGLGGVDPRIIKESVTETETAEKSKH
ncbi:hypothetical protein DMENIID0001_125170 [Sergentomyia squamirostris]